MKVLHFIDRQQKCGDAIIIIAIIWHCLNSMEGTLYSRLFILLVLGIPSSYPVLLGVFLFPHGPVMLDPGKIDPHKELGFRPNTTVAGALRLQEAMRRQASTLASLSPDLLIILSPEGVGTKKGFLAHGNIQSRGCAYWNGQWGEFCASTDIDINSTSKLHSWMENRGHPFRTVQFGLPTDPNFPLPLSWSEVVPLWFLEEAFNKTNNSPLPQSIIIVLPSSYEQNPDKLFNLMLFGEDLFRFIHHSLNPRKKVAILTFGDLSHNHLNSSESPFPYYPDASKFDEICTSWGKRDVKMGGLQSMFQLTIAASMTNHILSCGFNGILITQGIFNAATREGGMKFKAGFGDYAVLTYYSGMVTGFMVQYPTRNYDSYFIQ